MTLLALIDWQGATDAELPPAELVVRRSTAAPRPDDASSTRTETR